MRQLVYLASARRDLADIPDFISSESGSAAAGRRYVETLRQQRNKLALLSNTLGRARPELRADIRSFAFKDYVIFFRYDGERLEVVNIFEGHRDIEAFFERT